ncbi:MAG TPA: hypothetical protein DCK87_02490 [Desulfotomaculum sp.]|nr:hypothetical protein [Desulfotomaculum sp.]
MPVSDYMQTNVITISPGAPVWVAQRIMLENKIRHLPVVEEGRKGQERIVPSTPSLDPPFWPLTTGS